MITWMAVECASRYTIWAGCPTPQTPPPNDLHLIGPEFTELKAQDWPLYLQVTTWYNNQCVNLGQVSKMYHRSEENNSLLSGPRWERDKGEITFVAQGLLHKYSSLFSQAGNQARNHAVIAFLGENFAWVHERHSTSKDQRNACSKARWTTGPHLPSSAGVVILALISASNMSP